MSDIIGNDAAHPEWRQPCQAALFKLNPLKLLERIATHDSNPPTQLSLPHFVRRLFSGQNPSDNST
jgi:hypothetical protein